MRSPQFVEYLETRNFSEPLLLRLKREDQELSLSVQLVPYGDSEKLLLSRDITRWERMETTRRDFVANVSHELRTPLTVLGGFLETLSDMPEPDPEMRQRSLQLMARAGRAHASTGGRSAHAVTAGERAESVARRIRRHSGAGPRPVCGGAGDERGQTPTQPCVSTTSMACAATLEELRSAFTNLISNAVRYTPEQKEIEIAWTTREGGEPVFVVRDEGIGIEPHAYPALDRALLSGGPRPLARKRGYRARVSRSSSTSCRAIRRTWK